MNPQKNRDICAAVVIQARVSSTRLPGKALLDLSGKPMICHVIERAKRIRGADKIILATGDRPENRKLVEISESMGIDSYCGSEDNVLERYYMSVKDIDCNYVIRVTGDNPFTDYDSASLAFEYALENNADHCSILNIPVGTGVEIIKKTALNRAYSESTEPHQFEHVTPYLKEREDLFLLMKYIARAEHPFPGLRLTVDTDEDFRLAELIYKNLYHGEPFSLDDTIDFIKRNPLLADINKDIIQRSMTHHANE